MGAALKAPEPVQRLPMKPSGDSLQGLGPPGTPGAEAPLGGEHTFSPHQVWGRSRPPPPSPLIRPVANPDLSQDRGWVYNSGSESTQFNHSYLKSHGN